MTKIGTFYLCFSFLILFFLFLFPFYIFTLHFLFLFLMLLAFVQIKKVLQTQFCKEFLRFSSLLLIKMKMGMSFRSAYKATLDHAAWKHWPLHQEIFENVVFSQQSLGDCGGFFDSFLFQCEAVFRKVDSNPGGAIEQLETFRNELLRREKFRRRSMQIWGQIAAQGVVVLSIYIVFFTYTLWTYDFGEHRLAILTSLVLLVLGILSLFSMRKVPYWKL